MGHNSMVSGHSKSTGILQVDGLSTRSPGFRESHNEMNKVLDNNSNGHNERVL